MIVLQPTRRAQSGAALVVGLILLVAITLMAISSMNTASLDLIMAGNEQFRSRAFATAEAGIERALKNTTFDTSTDPPSTTGTTGTGDQYTYAISRPNGGAVEIAPPGNSAGTFGAAYFRITSTGTSARGSSAVNTQELFQIVRTANEFTCLTPGSPASCGL